MVFEIPYVTMLILWYMNVYILIFDTVLSENKIIKSLNKNVILIMKQNYHVQYEKNGYYELMDIITLLNY